MVGNAYLCFHLSSRKMLKLVSLSNSSARPTLKECDSISALDVQYLPSLKMLLVLDLNHSLTLYAGPTRLCKVHVPSFVFAPTREPECSLPYAVLPRRSSLSSGANRALPDMRASPGARERWSTLIKGLKIPDPYRCHTTSPCRMPSETVSPWSRRLERTIGLSLPAMSKDRIVKRCLKALSTVLPQELGVQVLMRWYMSRNAPGPTDLTASTEMHSFLLFILGTVGCIAASNGLQQVGGMDLDAVTPVAVKKSKSSEGGSNVDWEYLLERSGGSLGPASRSVPKVGPKMPLFVPSCETSASNVAPLQEHAYSVLTALHLVYEDAKLDVLEWPSLPRFAEFLYRLAAHLRLKSYQDLYRKDFPEKIRIVDIASTAEIPEGEPRTPSWFPLSPPNIFSWIANTMAHPSDKSRFLYIPGTTRSLKAVVLLYSVLSHPLECSFSTDLLQDISAASLGKCESHKFSFHKESGVGERIVSLLVKLGINLDQLSRWPSGVVAPLQDAMVECQDSPSLGWGPVACRLVGREDLAALTAQKQRRCLARMPVPSVHENPKQASSFIEKDNGFELLNKEMCKLKFSKDQRIGEACRMLQSSMPVCISIQQRPEVSDHEFVEEQERHLYGLCIRTMALPVGKRYDDTA
ncbi:hypothetical protein MTO96_012214 [Rhipicephalus appendiculatus]